MSALRWCWLGSHEIPEGERMVIPPRESSHICLPCAETERGKFLMTDRGVTYGYEGRSIGRWGRIYTAMGRPDYSRKRHGG